MKWFLLFLCLAAAEKLDRTYLPPPGAKFSGGAPGDIQAPFEIPKETYSTTLRPDVYNNGALSPEDTRIEVGINRGVPFRPGTSGDVTPGSQATDYYQTSKVPTTTTSYAFTTTTTHPPGEAYETGPINPVTGLPTTTFDYPTSAPGFLNPDVYNPGNLQGTFQQNQVPGRVPPGRPTQYPATTTLAPGSQFIDQNRPGFTQGSNLVRDPNQRPGVISGSVQRPNTIPGATQTQYQGSQYPGNVPGFGQQSSPAPSTVAPGTFVPTTFAPGTFIPTTFAPGTTPSSVQYGGNLDQGIVSNQNVPFAQGIIPEGPSSGAQGPYYPGQTQQQYVTPGQQLPQGVSQQPGQVIPQQYPISQTDEFGRPVPQNNVYQPFSTASPTTPISSLGQFPGSTPGSQPSITNIYPSSSFPTTPGIVGSQGIQTGLISRPERPQAEADRNAVILNYENVITPEGFAYSFDTSNGIHADESGTAIDGVKAKGSYSYIGDDGKLYSIVYTADENGFQPRGDHLPTSPPIPEAILKVIEQAKKDKEAGVSDDGTYDDDKYGHTKYEGGRYRPQRPNKVNVYDDVPSRYDGQYDQANRRQQLKPQKGRRPVLSNQDYEENGEGQDGDDAVNNEQRRPSTQKPYKRPDNRIPERIDGQYNPEIGLGEGSGDGLNDDKTSSQYPITQPGGDRRQFGGKFSVQRPGQYSESDEDYLRPEQGSILDENRPGSLSPQDNYNSGGSRRRPIDSQSIQSPDVISSSNQSSDRRPQYDNGLRPSGIVDDYNKESSSQLPGQYSGEYGISPVSGSTQGKYGNKIRPVISTAQPVDETDVYNYQDSRRPGGLDKYLPNKSYTVQPVASSTTLAPISSQYSESSVDDNKPQGIENVPSQNNRLSFNRLPSRIPGSPVYDSTGSQVPTNGRPVVDDGTFNQYSSSRGRPQSSNRPVPQQDNEYYGNRVIEPASSQNGRRPVPGRQPDETSRYTTVTPIKEEGYQYLPPQRKFHQVYQRPGTSQVTSSDGKPSQNRTFNKEGEVPKPFITPDASRYDEGTEDNYKRTQENNQYRRPQYNQVQPSQRPITTQQPYQTYEKESSPETYDETRRRPSLEQNGGYGTKSDVARIPNESGRVTTIGSTRRPPYQQIQSTRPQQQYRPGSVYETNQGVQNGAVRPQEGDRYITSTPVPSQSTRYEITQPSSLKPGQQTTDRYIGGGQTPSTPGFFTQTTKLPAQSSGQFDVRPTQNIYEQTSSQSPYQTTYKPLVSYSGVGSDEAPSTTIRPGRPFGRPGYSQSQVPSTTYRPTYPSQVTEKQVTVDNYGRPLPQQPIEGEYRPGTSVTPGISPSSQDSRRPVQRIRPVDMYGRPTGPVQGNVPSYAGPEGSSTTEKIIGEDFSGPKQQQRFDPERGYYY